jgi:cholesterol oxidase
MIETFDAVVIGSGFGGSVMAHRLAAAGRTVCLLERGRSYPPGGFPRAPDAMARNFWSPAHGLHGLFDLHLSRRLITVTAAGLGGGSLIYANVMLRKEERSFIEEDPSSGRYRPWPVSRADLDPHYDAVERLLRLQTYPFDRDPYTKIRKSTMIRDAAGALGRAWRPVPLAVTFAADGPGSEPVPGAPIRDGGASLHAEPRVTCRLCGECNIGCNYGAKSSLDHNILALARAAGAQLRTGCDVRVVRPHAAGGYEIAFHRRDVADARPVDVDRAPLDVIVGRRLILAAGALGSTRLLLANRRHLPRLSPALGSGFNGNGDVLALNFGIAEPVDPSFGPVITGSVEMDGAEIQDTAYPQFYRWVWGAAGALGGFPGASLRLAQLALEAGRRRNRAAAGAVLSTALSGAGLSPPVALCSMGREAPSGRLHLDDAGALTLAWDRGPSRAYYAALRRSMRQLAAQWGARQIDLMTLLPGMLSTVHPLGGCRMAEHEDEGVVDAGGEVFNYPGLYVADGSIMPGAVGVNPALTIAAMADRIADRMLSQPRGALS